MPNAIHDAVAAFRKDLPTGCTIHLPRNRLIYALVKIEGWPAVVHYEFRSNQELGLFVELHIEKKEYSELGKIFASFANRDLPIDGYKLFYAPGLPRPRANQKRWPSLSISLGPTVTSEATAAVMRRLISATRSAVTEGLGHWSKTRA